VAGSRALAGIRHDVVKRVVKRWHEGIVEHTHVADELPVAVDDRHRSGLEVGETGILLEVHAEHCIICLRADGLPVPAGADEGMPFPRCRRPNTGDRCKRRRDVHLLGTG
jgi:hypothetical protein